MNSFYTEQELKNLGLKNYGKNVLISRKISIYGSEQISIGNNVRIDDFCVLSGKISLGNHVHLSAGDYLFAGNVGIEMKDFSSLSSRVCVYAVSDDYSGKSMTNPVIYDKYKNIISKKIVIEKYSIVGTGSTILPGVVLSEGTSVGSMSLVNKTTLPWHIYVGIPAKPLKERSKNLLNLEKEFLKEYEIKNK